MIQAPESALVLARRFEGLRLRPYLCPAGVPTVGYGSTRYPDGRAVSLADPAVARDTAEAMLAVEMDRCARAVLRLCPALDGEPDDRLAALTDYVYNLGSGRLASSTLRRRVNQRDWPEVARELRKWVRGGGRVLPGLVLRREAEIALLGLSA